MRQFSAALAHELRTPLAALRGKIEMAMRQPGPVEAAERRASQLEEIDKLRPLIEQVLVLARAEAGDIPLALSEVDLGDLAAALVDEIDLVARAGTPASAPRCRHGPRGRAGGEGAVRLHGQGQTLPAGKYRIDQDDLDRALVVLRGEGGGRLELANIWESTGEGEAVPLHR